MSRVNEIRYVGYGVKDLEAEKAFYVEKWGLVQVPSSDGLTWLAAQGHDEHHVVRLRQDDSNRIDLIALSTACPHLAGRRLWLPLLLARWLDVRDLERCGARREA
jgi:catechol 2,3-dioxygenase-like lactoylglutathione lyase family enzyme